MAYYARKQGIDKFPKRKTNKDVECMLCRKMIKKGNYRHVAHYLSVCCDCIECWKQEGGMLGNISRAKENG